MKRKPSFFERLTGSVRADEAYEIENEYEDTNLMERGPIQSLEENMGELTVDVYQTPDEIIIKAMVAGVKPEDLDVDISRDTITISGERREENEVSEDDYYHKELFWGSFSRTIVLPAEIEVEEAQALEKHGLLEIHLPKIDRGRRAKLKVKSN